MDCKDIDHISDFLEKKSKELNFSDDSKHNIESQPYYESYLIDLPYSSKAGNNKSVLKSTPEFREKQKSEFSIPNSLSLLNCYEQTKATSHDECNDGGLFYNSMIRRSLQKTNLLSSIITKKTHTTLILVLDKWIENAFSNYGNILESNYYEDEVQTNSRAQSIETSHRFTPQLGAGNMGIVQIPSKFWLCFVLKNLTRSIWLFIFSKLSYSFTRKKYTEYHFSLLYLFTQLTISKNTSSKLGKALNLYKNYLKPSSDESGAARQQQDLMKLKDAYELKIGKMEANLNEKVSIICSKNDEIEAYKEKIELLERKIGKLEKKSQKLNIIPESICTKCENTLEESFFDKEKAWAQERSKDNESQLSKTISEQLDIILKLEEENKDVKRKNYEYMSRNETISKELDLIRGEFNLISSYINKPKSANETQTDIAFYQPEATLNLNVGTPNNAPLGKSKPNIESLKKNKSTGKILTKPHKLTKSSTTMSSTKKESKQEEVQNNFLEASNANNTSSLFDNSTSQNNLMSISNSSALTQEIINLNKECYKLRQEMKTLIEINKKMDKESKELKTKFTARAEQHEKAKRENDELKIMISTYNYKTLADLELDSRKVREELTQTKKSLEEERLNASRVQAQLNEANHLKLVNERDKEFEQKLKEEKDDWMLKCTKIEGEYKKMHVEFQTLLKEKANINPVLKEKDKQIEMLTENMNYVTLCYKKKTSETEQAFKDIYSYQQILRKLETELEQMKSSTSNLGNQSFFSINNSNNHAEDTQPNPYQQIKQAHFQNRQGIHSQIVNPESTQFKDELNEPSTRIYKPAEIKVSVNSSGKSQTNKFSAKK